MEIEAIAGEVRYSLRIPHLSTYNEEDHLTSEFSLSLGGLRSRWQVILQPFLSAKPNKAHDMNSDIGITLTCLTSSITFPDIDIYCNVVGRGQAHEKKLEHVVENLNVSDHATPTWQGVLVPRLALHVFNLLPKDTLTATLRFVVRADDVWRFNDPLEELSAQLGELRAGKHSDVTIVTSDGATLPAHSLILNARSELLQAHNEVKCSPDSFEKHTTPQSVKYKTERKQPATPLDSIFGSDMSSLSGYHSLSSSSCVSSPLGRPETSLVGRLTPASPAPSIPTPRRLFTPSNTPGEKRILSPCKSSPSKRPAPKVTSSPRRRVLQRENETPKRSPLPLSCHSVNSTSCSSSYSTPSKAPLKTLEISMPRYEDSRTLNVNMSSSVAKAMLDWIYTGTCSELGRLAKPLLVGGTRHGIEGLIQACEQHLAATLTPVTTPHTLLLAYKYSADFLLAATMKYAVAKAKEVTCQPSWASVATSAPALITEFSRLLALQTQPGRKR